MAPVLLWFGQYPSAWIILVEGYITAEHSSGTGIMSAPSSPSHHARAAGRGCPQGVGCSSSLPHLLCSELSLLWDNMAFLSHKPHRLCYSITGLFGTALPGTFPGCLRGHGTSDIPAAGPPGHKALWLSQAPGLVCISCKVGPFRFFYVLLENI